jgi:excisionase family DNA binding protein
MLLSLREVADRLKCSIANVYALKDSGHLVCIATGANGKGFRVSEEELERFMTSRSVAPNYVAPMASPVRQVKLKHLR